jgi:cobalt/nickel transport system permease protein
MHIPDGYLTTTVSVAAFAIVLVFWIISFRKIKLNEAQVPMMGLLTALFFAAMFANYPVFFGTTAHLLGAAVIGLILGPFAGCISMTIILVLQAFLFGDGGITTLGANVLNMGVIGVFIPAALFFALNKIGKPKNRGTILGMVFAAAFIGDLLAAIAAAVELSLSQGVFTYGLEVTLPAMVLNHSIIGLAEGIVSVIIVGTLLKLRPDVLQNSPILGKLWVFQNKAEVQVVEP